MSEDQGQNTETPEELFEQYWRYATHLRTWFIAFGVGALVLLTRSDVVVSKMPDASKRCVVVLLGIGLFLQVLLALVNKLVHYWAYRHCVVYHPKWYHEAAKRVSSWFLIDLVVDVATLGVYVASACVFAPFLCCTLAASG